MRVALKTDNDSIGGTLTMTNELRQAKAKSAGFLNSARQITEKYHGREDKEWEPEDREGFDKAMADFREAEAAEKRIEAHETDLAELKEKEARYLHEDKKTAIQHEGQSPTELPNGLTPEQHAAAFEKLIRFGDKGKKAGALTPDEIQALLPQDDTTGGYLVPDDVRAEVIRHEKGFTVFRDLVRVLPTTRDAVTFPVLQRNTGDVRKSSGFTGKFQRPGYVTGGTAPTTQDQPLFGQERIEVFDWQPDAVEISPNLLEDSATPIVPLLGELIAEIKAFDEDDEILKGEGVVSPLGFTQSGITTIASGDANLLTYGGLVDLTYNLAAQYRQQATYVMNSLTYGAILKLEDTAGSPLIPPNSTPDSLWAKPIRFQEQLDGVAAGNEPILFGAFRWYVLVERSQLVVKRLDEKYAPQIGFLPMARLGGKCVQTEAFRFQTISA